MHIKMIKKHKKKLISSKKIQKITKHDFNYKNKQSKPNLSMLIVGLALHEIISERVLKVYLT